MEVESSDIRVRNPSTGLTRKKKIIIGVTVSVIVCVIVIVCAVTLSGSSDSGRPRRRFLSPTRNSTGGNVTERVIQYIGNGTCGTTYPTLECGDRAIHFYQEFEYKGKRVVIFSQIPDHPAEKDQPKGNPNTRCTRWQFMQLPLNPGKLVDESKYEESSMDTIGAAKTGVGFFNYLANPQGGVAMLLEGDTMDSCGGHSAPGHKYHYHGNIMCITSPAANGSTNYDSCKHLGYHRDGVPVYGFCKDSNGKKFTSCYKLKSGAETDTVTTVHKTYTLGLTTSSYVWSKTDFDRKKCNLDKANGALNPHHGGKYTYFMTDSYPFMPSFYAGDQGIADICNAN